MGRQNTAADLPARLIDSASESLVLGNILNRGAEFWRVVGSELDESHFSVERHKRVFVLIRAVADSGKEPSLSGCYGRLLDMQKTPQDLGLPLLSELACDAFDIPNPGEWVARLKRKSVERKAWRLAERTRLSLESGGEDTAEELARVREELRGLESDLDPNEGSGTLMDAVSEIGIDNLLAEPLGVIGSPWPRLNGRINDGMRPGELWIVAARPSVGKTTVALQWALSACSGGSRVLFASLEMSTPDLLKRALAAQGGIHHGLLVRGDLDAARRKRVAETLDRIGGYRIEITDKLRKLRAIVSHIAAARPTFDLVVVDYLGLIESGGHHENRNQEVSALSRQLKLAALDYAVPILCAHQLNRANETENRRPQLSDLRDSGSLEQDADAVLMLDAPATRKRGGEIPADAIDVLISKQRNGERGGIVNLRMEPHFCRIVETSASAVETQ
jgi:replicative DNA helicase